MLHFLVTNDDGVEAPGIRALAELLSSVGEVTVVAPSGPWSGCSHQVTVDRHLSVERLGERRFAVDGTPADCVRVGLHALARNVDWVVSGINDGGNLGADIFLSGTVAAAREAALLGRRAIALSQYRRGRAHQDWHESGRQVQKVLQELLAEPPAEAGFWNVNLPALSAPELAAGPPAVTSNAPGALNTTSGLAAVVRCAPDFSQLPVEYIQDGWSFRYNGSYHQRPRRAGGDIDVCFSGHVAVSWIRLHAS